MRLRADLGGHPEGPCLGARHYPTLQRLVLAGAEHSAVKSFPAAIAPEFPYRLLVPRAVKRRPLVAACAFKSRVLLCHNYRGAIRAFGVAASLSVAMQRTQDISRLAYDGAADRGVLLVVPALAVESGNSMRDARCCLTWVSCVAPSPSHHVLRLRPIQGSMQEGWSNALSLP